MSGTVEKWLELAGAPIDLWLEKMRDHHLWRLEEWWSVCESPIEKIMAAHLSVAEVFGCSISLEGEQMKLGNKRPNDLERFSKAKDFLIEAWAQQRIGKYRVDFLILASVSSAPVTQIIIECDGHDFHERTKEQAARDRKRDREFTASGFKVFRFTGSEIYRNCGDCVAEITDFLESVAIEGVDGLNE